MKLFQRIFFKLANHKRTTINESGGKLKSAHVHNISIQNTSVYGWQCSTPVCLNGKLLYDDADIQLAILFV